MTATDSTTRAALLGVVIGLALLLIVGPVLVMTMMMGGGMMGMMGGLLGPGGMGGMMSLGWLALLPWLLIGVGLVLLVVWLARRRAEPGARAASTDAETPLAIPQRRYARGEIGREEYERMRADLLRDGGSR